MKRKADSQHPDGKKRTADQDSEAQKQYYQNHADSMLEHLEKLVRQDIERQPARRPMYNSLPKESFSQQLATLRRAYNGLMTTKLVWQDDAEIDATVTQLANVLKDKLRRHCPKESAHGIDKLEDMMMCLMNEFVWLQASKVLEAAIQEAESQKRALYQQAWNAEMMLKSVRNRGTP